MSRARRLPRATSVEAFVWQGAPIERRKSERAAAGAGSVTVAHTIADAPVRAEEIEKAERASFARGFEQGERSGRAKADERADALVQQLTNALAELAAARARVIGETERQLVELALAIARRIVHREVSIDADLLVAMARVALDRVADASRVTVRVNPDDYQRLGATRVAAMASSNVSVTSDARIPPGGCRVESDMGTLDAGIDAQLHEIAQALLGRPERLGAVALD